MNDEEQELYVGGRYQLVLIVPTALDLEIPDNVDEDDDDVLVEFFRQQTQAEALISLDRATIHQHNFVECHRRAYHVCVVVILLLQRPNLIGWLLI